MPQRPRTGRGEIEEGRSHHRFIAREANDRLGTRVERFGIVAGTIEKEGEPLGMGGLAERPDRFEPEAGIG